MHLTSRPPSRWNEKDPAVCIPTASHNVSNPHLFIFLFVLAYTYDTRTAPLITRLFVSAQNPEPAHSHVFMLVCQ